MVQEIHQGPRNYQVRTYRFISSYGFQIFVRAEREDYGDGGILDHFSTPPLPLISPPLAWSLHRRGPSSHLPPGTFHLFGSPILQPSTRSNISSAGFWTLGRPTSPPISPPIQPSILQPVPLPPSGPGQPLLRAWSGVCTRPAVKPKELITFLARIQTHPSIPYHPLHAEESHSFW